MSEYDFTLPISFSVAAEIGLEEAVLLAFLRQQSYLSRSVCLQGEIAHLLSQLPFWTQPMLLRILSSLQLNNCLTFERKQTVIEIRLTKDRVEVDKKNYREHQDYPHPGQSVPADNLVEKVERLSMSKKGEAVYHNSPASTQTSPSAAAPSHYYDAPARAKDRTQPTASERRRGVTDFDLYLEQKERTRQPDQWLPEEATLEQILQLGIPRSFALQLQAEFLLRIKEQRKNVRTWNSEFFKYVKRQWQYKQSDRSSNEGTSSRSYTSRTSKEEVSDALTNIHDTDW